MAKVYMSKFCESRHMPESGLSHYEGDPDGLLLEVGYIIENEPDLVEAGYRDGVLLVSVNPDDFFSSIVELREKDVLIGRYKARQAGETPRKSVSVPNKGEKAPAKFVQLVLYSVAVLKEDGGNEGHENDEDYLVISINASPTGEAVPMTPETMMYNYFKQSGGTDMKCTPEEFVRQLGEAFAFWKDRANLY